LPKKLRSHDGSVCGIPVKPSIAVAFLLRNLRLKLSLSQRKFAKKLGFKNLWSYQRLERSGNPELKTLEMIKRKFPDMPLEDILDID
jgi:DNA-binding XRE family transcriptional regulator